MSMSSPMQKIVLSIGLLALALGVLGGTCVVVEEGPPGSFDGPGENEEEILEQERDIR